MRIEMQVRPCGKKRSAYWDALLNTRQCPGTNAYFGKSMAAGVFIEEFLGANGSQ